MIACLPMYDWPELTAANDALWAVLRERLCDKGLDAPAALHRTGEPEEYADSDHLLLGQTCGYPLATRFCERLQYVATPHYNAEGCESACYSSAVVARRGHQVGLEDTGKLRLAYNSRDSLSGYRALQVLVGPLEERFGSLHQSGSHRQSARAVVEGEADLAALDAVCWHFLKEYEPETADRLQVVAWSDPWPALPLVTSPLTSQETLEILRTAIQEVFAAPETAACRRPLAIAGCSVVDIAEYRALAAL